jgi:hypothetical protein
MRRRPARRILGRLAAAVAIAGCNTPVPFLRIGPTEGPTQACPSTLCVEVPLLCPAIMSIRIVDPKEPDKALLSQCSVVIPNATQLCAIAGVDLKGDPLPVRDLDVQVALYPMSAALTDPAEPGSVLCPIPQFSLASGFPIEQTPAPALGGHTIYRPGDAIVNVALGCTDLGAINDSCGSAGGIEVSATVNDFPTQVQVTDGAGATLRVELGEPRPAGDSYVIDPDDTQALMPVPDSPIRTWAGALMRKPDRHVCIDLLENAAATTATLTCQTATSATSLDLRGAWLKTGQLAEYLRALGISSVPNEGLTIGVVVDRNMNPVAGATVTLAASSGGAPGQLGTVQYLTKNRLGLSGTATSDHGIFLSTNAGFGTEFTAHAFNMTGASGVGGLVKGRVTIVVLQLEPGP